MTSSRPPPTNASPSHASPTSPAPSETLTQTSTNPTPIYSPLPLQLPHNLPPSLSEHPTHQILPMPNAGTVVLPAHDPQEGHSGRDGYIGHASHNNSDGDDHGHQQAHGALTRHPGIMIFGAAPSAPPPRIYIRASPAQYLESTSSCQGICRTSALREEDVLSCPSPGSTGDGPYLPLLFGEVGNTSGNEITPAVSEQDRIEERNRKGRERSLRTRHRNANRLRLLQENCWYLCKENEMLREILKIWEQNKQWGAVLEGLLEKLEEFRETRPEPYVPGSL